MRKNTHCRVVAALTSATALALGTVLVTAPVASAGGGDTERVRMLDDCEPASFNAFSREAFGVDICEGDGGTEFDDFVDQLMDRGMKANQSASGWKFDRDEFHIDEGDRLRVVNLGGEFHTFTEVERFGPGCEEGLNHLLGLGDAAPIEECEDESLFMATGVPAGGTLHVYGLDPGTHKFECLIHPWMQSVVTVRADDDDHDDDHSGHH